MLFLPFATVAVVGMLAASPALAQYLNQTPPDHYIPSVGAPDPSMQPTPGTATSGGYTGGSYYGGSSTQTYSNPSTAGGYGQQPAYNQQPAPVYSQQPAPVYAPTPDPNFTPPPAPAQTYNAPAYNNTAPAPAYSPAYNNAAPASGVGAVPAANPNAQPMTSPAFGNSNPSPATGYSAPMGQQPAAQTNGDFVSGGVGGSDQERMRSIEKDYTLKVLFAGKNGDYLAIVNVSITDKNGTTLYNQATDGPILLARLKPGTYKLHAELDGNTSDTTVSVGKNLRSIIIRL